MKYQHINGTVFEKMMRSALKNIRLHEKEINDMNVFPIPDGDTGTNMRRTLEMGVESAGSAVELNEYLKGLSSGMLLGARGNSGVILSQIFAGFYDALTRYSKADADNLCTAFIKGYNWAYAAVIRPVEGTILTVIREGIERTKRQLYRKTTVDTMFGIFISEMQRTLLMTPELLPVLKEAGVVDSGGFGLIKIVEGMIKGLHGEEIEEVAVAEDNVPVPEIDDSFGPNSVFEDGYCMEFMLQLMNRKRSARDFNLNYYIEEIGAYGTSLVALQNDTRVRVHIHTVKPEKIISISRAHGEFISFKLDNMQLQHNEFKAAKKKAARPHKAVSLLAVADGEGFLEMFKGQGCDLVIDGGRSMSTSVKKFMEAYEELNADTVIVVPNDKNVVFAARQAAEMYKNCSVEILPTESMVQGYFAIASDLPDESASRRSESMREGMDGVISVAVVRCAKDRVCHGVACKEGGYAAFINGEIKLSEEDAVTAAVKAIGEAGTEGKEQIVVFKGKGFTREEELEAKLNEAYSFLQVYLLDGGQNADEILLGLS